MNLWRTLVKNGNGHLAYSQNSLNSGIIMSYVSQLLNKHKVSNVSQMKMHASVPDTFDKTAVKEVLIKFSDSSKSCPEIVN
jgi:hypothetical protein